MQNAAAGAHVWGSGNAGDHRGASFTATEDFHPHSSTGVIIAGRYKLEQRIGEGGMGEVWVAKQSEPVKRKVALKLIKAGMDSRAVVQRFEQERQALALMDHPNIAKVLDGGITADRRPFFVMELVNGLPLTKFCDEAKLGNQGTARAVCSHLSSRAACTPERDRTSGFETGKHSPHVG